MTITHTLSIENERGASANYAVFMEPPEFSGGQQPWMNVWFTSFVPDHGNLEVLTESEIFPWTGTVSQMPSPGVIVNSGMNLPGELGTDTVKGSTFDLKIVQGFPSITPVTSTASPGAFDIDTGSDFTMPNDRYLVGIAKRNNRGQVASVASLKFFVTESQQVAGEIVDYNSVAGGGAAIDFTSEW